MLLKKLLKFMPEKMRHKFIRSKIKLGEGAPANIIFKLADTKDELEQAFRVLHDAYVHEKYMSPHPSGMRVTKYHALPTTAVLIAKDTHSGLVVGTVSIVRDTPLGLPLDSAFPLEGIKKQYRHLAEVSSLAIRKEYRKDPAELLWPLLRYFYKYLRDDMKVDAYVIGVNPIWHDLYVGILGFTKLEGFQSTNYNFANNAPVSAYFVNVLEQEMLFYKFYAHLSEQANFYKYCIQKKMESTQYRFPNRKYHSVQTTVMTQDFLDYFFIKKTETLKLMTDEERAIIQFFYPKKEFSKLIHGDRVQLDNFRSSNRFITRFNARIKSDRSYEDDIEVAVLDFSINGIRIATDLELPFEVDLCVGIGEYHSAYLRAQVRRRYQGSLGLEIISADQAWGEFITEMQRQFQVETRSEEMPPALKLVSGGLDKKKKTG